MKRSRLYFSTLALLFFTAIQPAEETCSHKDCVSMFSSPYFILTSPAVLVHLARHDLHNGR